MKFTADYRVYRILAVGWMAAIYLLSSMPDLSGPALLKGQDKLFHVLFFALLGGFFICSFKPSKKRVPFTRVLWVTLLVAGYGVFDELHQMHVPGRDASIADLAADAIGGFLAALILWKRPLSSKGPP
ncbi:MAG: VanZ family protein [Desulfatiglandaceae bacterium]